MRTPTRRRTTGREVGSSVPSRPDPANHQGNGRSGDPPNGVRARLVPFGSNVLRFLPGERSRMNRVTPLARFLAVASIRLFPGGSTTAPGVMYELSGAGGGYRDRPRARWRGEVSLLACAIRVSHSLMKARAPIWANSARARRSGWFARKYLPEYLRA